MSANLATYIVGGNTKNVFHDVSSSKFKVCLGETAVSLAQTCFKYVSTNAASLIQDSRIYVSYAYQLLASNK